MKNRLHGIFYMLHSMWRAVAIHPTSYCRKEGIPLVLRWHTIGINVACHCCYTAILSKKSSSRLVTLTDDTPESKSSDTKLSSG